MRTTPGRPAVVVAGLDTTQGLQTARVFARRDVPVIGIVSNPSHFAAKTNVCEQIVVAKTNKPAVVEALQQLGPSLRQKAVLVPCQDMTVKLISDSRDLLTEWYLLKLPEQKVVDLLLDKTGFYEYARVHGLPIPKTVLLRSRSDVALAAEELSFPCILKPPWRPNEWVRHTKSKAFLIATPEELSRAYDHYSEWVHPLIAQDWVPGGDDHHYTCNVYFNDSSEHLVTFVSQKLRQWQPVTGRGCLAIEARNDDVLEATVSLFHSLPYSGLGYLEMKRHEDTGEYFIIEPNVGRPTGRAAMAEAAGVELMLTMYCDLVGLPLPARRQQTYEGVKWVHLLRDLQAAMHDWRRGSLTIGEWMRSLRGTRAFAVLSLRDPRPFLSAVIDGLSMLRSDREKGLEDHV